MNNVQKKIVFLAFIVALSLSFLAAPVCAGEAEIKKLITDLKSKDAKTRQKASNELAKMGKPAVEAISEFLDLEDDDKKRAEAVKVLGKMKDSEAMDLFVEILADDFEESPVRKAAFSEAQKINNPMVNEAFLEVVTNEDDKKTFRKQSLEQIVKRNDKNAIGPIIDYLEDEEDKNFKKNLAKALKSLTGQDFGTNEEKWSAWWAEKESEKKESVEKGSEKKESEKKESEKKGSEKKESAEKGSKKK